MIPDVSSQELDLRHPRLINGILAWPRGGNHAGTASALHLVGARNGGAAERLANDGPPGSPPFAAADEDAAVAWRGRTGRR